MDAKQKKALSNKKYYLKNKEKIKQQVKSYRTTSAYKESFEEYKTTSAYKESNKKYRQSEKGKKTNRISHWKRRGVFHEDFNALYDIYLNTHECEECGVTLSNEKKRTSTTKCLDHCHETGLFRNILCHACNVCR